MKIKTPAADSVRFHGVFTALVTPMKANGDIDYAALGALTEELITHGMQGLIPLGSTGEYYALSAEERERVIRTTLEAAARRVPVVVGTNAGSTREVIDYSRKAEKLGASGLLLAPPYYSLPTLDELFAHFREVNNAVGVPIMLYNYPGRTGVDMPPDFIEQLTTLKNVRYIKESTGELQRITTLIRRCGDRLGVFCGCDTLALQSLMIGAIGWVGGVANALPLSHVELYQLAALTRDYPTARKMFFQMLPLLELMENGGKYTQWVKAACDLMGHPVGSPRPPLRAATQVEIKQLRKTMMLIPECQQPLRH